MNENWQTEKDRTIRWPPQECGTALLCLPEARQSHPMWVSISNSPLLANPINHSPDAQLDTLSTQGIQVICLLDCPDPQAETSQLQNLANPIDMASR